ncbi:MAG: aldehyde dehydrogenase family protein [Sphingopyxis sp.]|nr:aldehyde dehydrogenase family protein [Sphingopyxis sp.]
MTIAAETAALLRQLGVADAAFTGGDLFAHSPIDGSVIGAVHSSGEIDAVLARAAAAFLQWRSVPAPKRGELVRLLGEELRAHKDALARLVTIEAGKVVSEGQGEVQEMIDIADFAVGMSRQLHGLTIATERPDHRMMEQWHPLGVVGIITAFNFPVAVWAWNAALALVCGDPVVWKPSEKTPLTALAVQAIMDRALDRYRAAGHDAPDGLAQLVIGGRDVGAALVDDPRVALVSATGSTAMGRVVGPRVAARFGRSLLELGGNNAAIIAPSADLDLALRGVAFAAMGTAGQRCTTLRRLFVHDAIYPDFTARLRAAYASVAVGDPRAPGVLVGPLIDAPAGAAMDRALAAARALGGTIHGGERVLVGGGGVYVRPALVEMGAQTGPVCEETFAPILYIMRHQNLDDAILAQNAVAQGLSSAIFTTDMREAERFLSAAGSDCGIANVNLGTSGAEIGGAFGGEKETGGGRESGSDAWRAYMRRATNSINYGRDLPLAQGVTFAL